MHLYLGVLAGWAPGANQSAGTASEHGAVGGFWLGLWHGFIAPFVFVVSLFKSNLSSYEVHKKVFPDSFQIILNQYLGKPEVKSLAPDSKACKPETEGLLGRTRIVARRLIPVGKETDRHWEQGEDPSMLDPRIQMYGSAGKLVVADDKESRAWRKIGVRKLMRSTKLTQASIYSILSGKGVRPQTMAIFRAGANALASLIVRK